MSNKKWALFLAVLIISSLVLAACPAGDQSAGEATAPPPDSSGEVAEPEPSMGEGEKATVQWNLGTEPPTADPALASDNVSVDVTENLFLGLTGFDTQGNIEPELATEWAVSDDGLVWTFNMRDNAMWVRYTASDGVVELGPVTASDVVYGVRRTCDPRTGSDYAYVDYIIADCQALNEADLDALSEEEAQALIEAVGVQALDDYTVQFTINSPAPYFPAIAGMWVNRPMPQETIEANGESWTEPDFIVTNGPYAMVEWLHSDTMVLEKNPLWYGWAEGAPGNVDRFELFMLEEASTEFAMYEANDLDSAQVPLPDMDRVKADAELSQELVIIPDSCSYYFGFTNTKAPLDNILVRKALSAAIDRQSMVDNVLKGGQIPANTFAPSMIFGNAAEDPEIAPWALSEGQGGLGYAAALEQAKAWLAEAGYPNGEGFPTLSIMHNTSESHGQIAQAVQAMWKEGLGINVDVENQEWRVYLTTIQKDTPIEEMPHVWRFGWCADYPDENNWVHEVFNTNAGPDRLRWEADANAPLSPDGMSFNELTEAAQKSTDPAERQAFYREAEKILSETAAAYAPIYYYTKIRVTKPYLERTYYTLGGNRLETWVLDWEAKKAATGL